MCCNLNLGYKNKITNHKNCNLINFIVFGARWTALKTLMGISHLQMFMEKKRHITI